MQTIECRACAGSGILADDEGWQYTCSVCFGEGEIDPDQKNRSAKVLSVDENNRLLD